MKQIEIPCPQPGDTFFFGLKRSGNHAILHWLLSHFENYKHYNNIFVQDGKFYVDFVTDIDQTSKPPYTLKVYSLEDRKEFSGNLLETWGSLLPNGKNIMILRDPYNMFASRLQVHREPPKVETSNHDMLPATSLKKIWTEWQDYLNLDMWIWFAKEFIGETCYLGKDCIKINYNKWLSDRVYRDGMSDIFGGGGKEMDYTTPEGGGSSFDGMKPPKVERLTSRWLHFRGDEEYAPLLRNKEIKELSKEIFGFLPNRVSYL